MESIFKGADKATGYEVLYFENAEVEKTKGDQKVFASEGNLSLLYFKDYNRFVLQLNDWRYPLLRRLPAYSSSSTTASRTFTFPGLNDAQFNLKINDANTFALSNFETILKNQSNFGYESENVNRKIELSPDDKVTRSLKKDTGAKEYVSGMVKQAFDKVKHLTETAKTGTRNLNSRKQMMRLSDIKNKNFDKTAKSTFKKDYFNAGEKLSQTFTGLRGNNINNTQNREWNDLSKYNNLPVFFIPKLDIENAILQNKDIASQGNYGAQGEPRRAGFMGNLKSGIEGIKGTVTGAIQNTRTGLNNLASDIAHRVHPTQQTVQPADKEGMIHYQG